MTTTFDSANKNANLTLSNGDLTVTNDGVAEEYGTALTTVFKATGKWFWEVEITAPAVSTHVGIALSTEPLTDTSIIGVGADSYSFGDVVSFAYKRHNGTDTAYGYAAGDMAVVGVVWDADAGTVSFWLDGAAQGEAFSGVSGSFCFAISLDFDGSATANFGATNFSMAPPAGSTGIDGDGQSDVTATVSVSAAAPTLEARIDADGVDKALPVPSLVSGTNGIIGTAPSLSFVITGYTVKIDAGLTAPVPTLSCSVLTGGAFGFEGTAPAPTLECHTKDFRGTAPAPTLSATLLRGSVIAVEARARAPVLVAVLDNPAIITASCAAASPQLSSALLAGNIAAAVLAVRAPTLSVQALTGNVATILATAASPIMAAAGYPSYTLTFAGTAPVPQLSAVLSGAVTENYRTWVLNSKVLALTEYTNFSFNSFAVFNGTVLACGSSGVVTLGTQDLDNATAITGRFRTGKDSFSSSFHKRVPRLYVSLEADGDLYARTITSEGGTRTYLLGWNNATGLAQRRVPVGRGPKSRFWQFEVENVAGADFSVNDLLCYPVVLKRRVQ